MVKRVNPEYLSARDDWEVISLKDGDEVVAPSSSAPATRPCASSPATASCSTSAPAVRPQGGPVRHRGRQLGAGRGSSRSPPSTPSTPWSSRLPARSSALPGTEAGSVKVTPFSEYPAKGRATGGVRCHRFLKGEDGSSSPGRPRARAAAADSGAPVDLPEPVGRRDGSGLPGSQPIAACAGPVPCHSRRAPHRRGS